jgi:hypothetical protein
MNGIRKNVVEAFPGDSRNPRSPIRRSFIQFAATIFSDGSATA